MDDVTAECGAGGDCGSCRDEIQSMIDGADASASGCDHCPRRHHGAHAGASR